MKEKTAQFIIIFGIGGFLYGLIEIIYRGRTHWTMFLLGGALFTLLYYINLSLKTRSMIVRGLIGSAVITAAEFAVGLLVNRKYNLMVWDYSNQPGNILGQICPSFSLAWFFLTIASVYLSVFLYWQLNKRLRLCQDFG
ncbi:MAG: hypothetical protein ACI4XE_04520 [Acutalibacteraceae bacterium]